MNSDIKERVKIINELDKNLLVSASAGSGKTTILVERMVALVEAGKYDLSKMAAITFTKKAAGEFYDRFYKKLQLRTKPGFDYKNDDKYSLLGNPTPEAIKRDKEALSHIDSCFFGTIDAFYQKILNEHPIEAGLSSSATIVDDEQFNNYLIKTFSSYLKSENKDIREKAEFFAKNVGAPLFPKVMVDVLSHIEKDVYQIPDNIDDVLKAYKETLPSFKLGCRFLCDNEASLRPFKIDKNTGDTKDETTDNKAAWDYLLANIDFIESLKDDDYRSALTIFKALEGMRFNDDSTGSLYRFNFISNCSEVFFKNKKEHGRIIKNNAYVLLKKIRFYKTIDFIQFVKNDIYTSMVDNGYLTFGIATDCLLKMLRNDKENKTAIEQIRNKIDCLLIDECQDTDMSQYEIFFRLSASNFPKDFKDAEIQGGKLYACGDRKQGIYHFRGADVSTYDYIKSIFEDNKKKGLPFELVTLTDNHRSNGKLINYFNHTFENVLSSQGYSPILNDSIEPKEEKFECYSYPTNKEDDPVIVAKLILQMKKEHNYSFKDFMVMTSNKDNIIRYSRAFAKMSIPCYSEGKIDIHVSPLLDAVIGLFKYIGSNKQDTISYLEVLSSPLFGFDIRKTIDLKENYLEKLGIPLTKSHWPSDLLESLVSCPSIIKALNCKGIDVLFGFIHLLKEQENSGEISNYDDAIKYFQKLQSGDLDVERLSLLANDIDAVQIANAHKTKGLEKKVVILTRAGVKAPTIAKVVKDKFYNVEIGDYNKVTNPYSEESPISTLIDEEKDYLSEENKRLLYVAATRARDYLFISQNFKDGKVTASKWAPLLVCEKEVVPFELCDCGDSENKTVELTKPSINCSLNKTKEFHIVKPSKSEAESKFDENYETSSLSREDALLFGTMTHKLMEFIIKSANTVLPDSIVDYVVSSYNGQAFKEKLLGIKSIIYSGGYSQKEPEYDDILAIAKQGKCYEEVPFSYMEDDKVVNGSIDLIIERENDVLIVDYKTDANDLDHTNQLDYYKKAAINSSSFKGKEIKTIIYNIKK